MDSIKQIMKTRPYKFGNCFIQGKGRKRVFTPFFIIRDVCYGIEITKLSDNIVKLNAELPIYEFQKEVANLYRDHRKGKFLWKVYFRHHKAGIIADIDKAIAEYKEIEPAYKSKVLRNSFWDYNWPDPELDNQFERAILKA